MPGDIPYVFDVFLYDIGAGTFSNLTQIADAHSTNPSISADGSKVEFLGNPLNLTGSVPNGQNVLDGILLDRTTGTYTDIIKGANYQSYDAVISADGMHVTYSSFADTITPGEANGGYSDVFIYDVAHGKPKWCRAAPTQRLKIPLCQRTAASLYFPVPQTISCAMTPTALFQISLLKIERLVK